MNRTEIDTSPIDSRLTIEEAERISPTSTDDSYALSLERAVFTRVGTASVFVKQWFDHLAMFAAQVPKKLLYFMTSCRFPTSEYRLHS